MIYRPCEVVSMDASGGMVAVVQGLRDAGLAVTLLDGGRQYTLMPNQPAPLNSPQLRARPSVNCASQHTPPVPTSAPSGHCRENGVQATDGRYTSTYKMMHCNINPTSPPQTVTEFPPQRSDVLRGEGNFVVGGYGSGETCCPAVKTNSFKGGMCWPDRGSVCASRPSTKSDAFANSLRKYPNVSPERSTEIVERLISYTQAKHSSKNQQRFPYSPNRSSVDSKSSKQTFLVERNSSKNPESGKTYQPEVTITKLTRPAESSPPRVRSRNVMEEDETSWNRFLSCKSNEVRCFRDASRRVKQAFRNLGMPTPGQLSKSSSSRIIEREQCYFDQNTMDRTSNNLVNMEIQVAPKNESKEILTLPRIVPMQRTVMTQIGMPLSPITSKMEAKIEEELKLAHSYSVDLSHICSCKSIQVRLPAVSRVKVTSSSLELRDNKYASKYVKRSKSKEELGNIKNAQYEIVKLLQMLNKYSTIDTDELSFDQVKESLIKKKGICQNCKHLFEEFDILRKSVSDNTYLCEDFQFNMNRAETNKNVNDVLQNCESKGIHRLDEVPCSGYILQECVNKSKYLCQSETSDNTITPNSETEIENRTSKTMDVLGIDRNYCHYTNGLLDKLVDRKRWRKESINNFFRNDKDLKEMNELHENEDNHNNILSTMTEEELRNLIDLDIFAFAEKYRLNITMEILNDLIEELFDVFIVYSKCDSGPNNCHIAKNIKKILQNKGLSEFHSAYLTNILTEHWEEGFQATNKLLAKPSTIKSKTFIVLPNITQDSSKDRNAENNNNTEYDLSINKISQKDIDTNVDAYITQIFNEINEWLINLHLAQDNEIRLDIITNLANEIVDRQKYLELNPSTELSDSSELEYLKYQIFKWIHKLLGVTDMTPMKHAPDLMKRVKKIPVPIFSLQQSKLNAENGSIHNAELGQCNQTIKIIEPSNLGATSSRRLSSPGYKCCKRATCKRNLNKEVSAKSTSSGNYSLRAPESDHQATESTRRMSSPGRLAVTDAEYNVDAPQQMHRKSITNEKETGIPFMQSQISTSTNMPFDSRGYLYGGIHIRDDENDKHKDTSSGLQLASQCQSSKTSDIKKINDDYIQYLKEWVKQIPIPVNTSEEQIYAVKTRANICNEIFDIISKLRTKPEIFNNRFLCEDILDDEIEKILSNLPQSSELNAKKRMLKARIIEKTSDINELIKFHISPSYKHQLITSVKNSLPDSNESQNADVLKIYEELQILNIVEDFIIYLRYQHEDKVMMEAYRNKLVKHTEDFIEKLKANYGKALQNIDTKLYISDIINTLKSIPLPSEDIVKDEADEILLSLEIDKWFSKLPLTEADDFVEQLHRRRLRNNLAKHIREIEKGTGYMDSSIDNLLKQEISQVLDKAPLQQGQSLNKNSMINVLINRIKNRRKSIENDTKKVVFNEPDYREFSRNIPFSSTFTGHPEDNIGNHEICDVSNNKSIQASEPTIRGQSYRHYHNISKPLLDDLQSEQMPYDANISLQQIPNYEKFLEPRPRSSSLKSSSEPQWYTLEESKQQFSKLDHTLTTPHNQNTSEVMNKSVQAIEASEDSHSKHYHNIAKPLFDDLRLDTSCCERNKSHEVSDHDMFKEISPRRASLKDSSQPQWYTLQESRQAEPNQQLPDENLIFVPSPFHNRSMQPKSQDRNNQANSFHDVQHFKGNIDEPQNTGLPKLGSHNLRNSSKIAVKRTDEYPNYRRISNPNEDHRCSTSHPPGWTSPRRRDSLRINQPNMRPDQGISPHREPYDPTNEIEPNNNGSNRSAFHETCNDRRRRTPELGQSDLYYKSTDQEGIRRTIERNRSTEKNMDRSVPEAHLPAIGIRTHGYGPLNNGNEKGRYMIDSKTYVRDPEEESDNENEDDAIPCHCIEMLKRKRRPRYCPFDQYDGYPMCLSTPYFYPYFY